MNTLKIALLSLLVLVLAACNASGKVSLQGSITSNGDGTYVLHDGATITADGEDFTLTSETLSISLKDGQSAKAIGDVQFDMNNMSFTGQLEMLVIEAAAPAVVEPAVPTAELAEMVPTAESAEMVPTAESAETMPTTEVMGYVTVSEGANITIYPVYAAGQENVYCKEACTITADAGIALGLLAGTDTASDWTVEGVHRDIAGYAHFSLSGTTTVRLDPGEAIHASYASRQKCEQHAQVVSACEILP